MRLLFEMDTHDYKSGGTVGRRPSVRGIVVRDGYLLMVHSLRDRYYKLPGGGIDGDETHADTLIREVHEETGMRVTPESIREYGLVRRISKGQIEDIFVQENFYYFCDAEETGDAQSLDLYEQEERFTPEWVRPADAIAENERALHTTTAAGNSAVMVTRENRLLQMLMTEYPQYFAEKER